MVNTDDLAKKNGKPEGLNSEEKNQLAKKAESLKVPYLDAAPEKISKADLEIIPEDLSRKYQMAVFGRLDKVLKVAMIDPQNFEALNVLRFIAEKDKWKVEIYLASQGVFEEIIGKYSSAEKAIDEAVKSLNEEDAIQFNQEQESAEKETIQDAPITKLVQVIIKHAIEGRASDIHIEPMDSEYRVRFRVDGILYSSLTLPKSVGVAVISRIKILSNLKIDERRKPQDGRFHVSENNKKVDFRVSTLPVIDGEKVVMRVLNKEDKLFDLKSLGVYGRNLELFNRKILEPYGIILLTGPTGSGKSTTLYAFLQILNKEERNIVTLEDPVEYYVDGINQSQIKPEIGYTFANGLRSILRQDPNVIMVGEIRDSETAELAIHSALTGHLVFSTLHTNDAIGAIPRMIDMGVEPFLLSSSLRAVAAQRLVRRLCDHCKEEIKIPPEIIDGLRRELENISQEEVKNYEIDLSKEIIFYQGKGCDKCNSTGYKGRIAIYEALEVTTEIQELISGSREKDNESAIKQKAVALGMTTIRQDGILKAIKGLTTISEIERVTEGNLSVGGAIEEI